MSRKTLAAVTATLLVCGSGFVFLAFDRNSHSASDTLRPFVLTMAPVWLVGFGAAWALRRRR